MLFKGSVILLLGVVAMDGRALDRLSFELNLSKAVETFACNSDVFKV